MTNALKHAAPLEVCIELTARRGRPILRIVNDGRAYRPPRRGRAGLGLHIVRHRAGLIGAEITIERGQPDGCVVTCALSPVGR